MADHDDADLGGGAPPKGVEGAIFDTVRRTVSSSVRSLLLSEEGLRTLVAALVPKEAGQAVLRELGVLRSELFKATMAEMSKFLQRLDPAAEIQKVLAGLVFDIHVTIGVDRKKQPSPPDPSPSDVQARPVQRPARMAKPRHKPGNASKTRPAKGEHRQPPESE